MQPDRFADELASRMPNVACFHAQQAAEKALKAWLVVLSGDVAREHLMHLAELSALGVPIAVELREDALALGKFYTTTRYPDALGGADPRTAFLALEANDAVKRARRVVESAASALDREQRTDSRT